MLLQRAVHFVGGTQYVMRKLYVHSTTLITQEIVTVSGTLDCFLDINTIAPFCTLRWALTIRNHVCR